MRHAFKHTCTGLSEFRILSVSVDLNCTSVLYRFKRSVCAPIVTSRLCFCAAQFLVAFAVGGLWTVALGDLT